MRILAVETSSSRGSLAFIDTDNFAASAERFWHREKSHSEVILTEYEAFLKVHKLQQDQIDAYAVGLGPGSFTGLRVGINFVRTLAYSFNKPVYTENSLKLLALEPLNQTPRCLCLVNAFRNKLYTAGYEKTSTGLKTWLEPQALGLDELESTLSSPVQVYGNGMEAYLDHLSAGLKSKLIPPPETALFPRAEAFKSWFQQDSTPASPKSWSEVVPLYIRASEAEEKLERN